MGNEVLTHRVNWLHWELTTNQHLMLRLKKKYSYLSAPVCSRHAQEQLYILFTIFIYRVTKTEILNFRLSQIVLAKTLENQNNL